MYNICSILCAIGITDIISAADLSIPEANQVIEKAINNLGKLKSYHVEVKSEITIPRPASDSKMHYVRYEAVRSNSKYRLTRELSSSTGPSLTEVICINAPITNYWFQYMKGTGLDVKSARYFPCMESDKPEIGWKSHFRFELLNLFHDFVHLPYGQTSDSRLGSMKYKLGNCYTETESKTPMIVIGFEPRPEVTIRYWIDSAQDYSVRKVVTESKQEDFNLQILIETDKFMNQYWYPKKMVSTKYTKGKLQETHGMEIFVRSLNQPIPEEEFTIQKFNLPADTVIYEVPPSGKVLAWDGTKLMPPSQVEFLNLEKRIREDEESPRYWLAVLIGSLGITFIYYFIQQRRKRVQS